MERELEIEIAQSLEITPELLPYVNELTADLWALGSNPELYVEILKPLGLPPDTTKALDLGCGKGAAAVTLAKELGYRVIGLDWCGKFIEEAQRKAQEYSVSNLCSFIQTDIRSAVNDYTGFDIAVFSSVGDALGNLEQAVMQIRRAVKPGGYMLIDDSFLKEPVDIDRWGYEYCASYEETIRRLTAQGDTIVKEIIFTDDDMKAMNEEYTGYLTKRAERLADKHPELTGALKWYLDNQMVECGILEKYLFGAVWLLKRE
ncbi:class I SAM-dependent methyltransferase [bacterium]|nr:class I SAM-dependent methyltransferase [FCB group bacterium]MBL7192296.1 class I SAM-dependent methyltransferase [bacterium]